MIAKMRAVLFTLGSFLLTAAVIGHAYYQRKQFYPSVVFITKSNPSMAVIYTQGFVLVLLLGKLMRKLFFGQLRAAEFEHLIERSWYAVTETCLAFTVFRDDFSPKFVALFTLLLFLKSFHWLAEDRVDFMERSPVVTWLFHIRILSLLVLLGALDYLFVSNAYHSTISKGPSVQLVFGFEYAILLTIMTNISIKYILHTIDIESDNPWEAKAVYLLHTELVIGFVKVILYAAFMFIMVKIHTFPLFAIRPMYLTTRAFKRALQDVIMSRRAIRNMNHLYPDVTAEELANSDSTCIICREEMTSGAKRLPCNHIFHTLCLRSWFQRQQTCPTCRLDVLQTVGQPQQAQNAAAGAAAAAAAAANQNQGQNGAAAARPQPARGPQAGVNADQPRIPPPVGFPPFIPFQYPRMPHAGPGQENASGGASQLGPSGAAAPTAAASAGAMPFPMGMPWPPMPFGQPPTPQQAPGQQTPPPPFPLFMPPPPFMIPPGPVFWPAAVAPPAPPVNFEGLTKEELEALKGQEEENLRSRITCLRNIQCLLDAAVLQMHQYALATGSQTFRNTNEPSVPNFEALLKNLEGRGDTRKMPASSEENAGTTGPDPAEGASGFTPPPDSTSPQKEDGAGANDGEADDLRRLRLRKFANDTNAATMSST